MDSRTIGQRRSPEHGIVGMILAGGRSRRMGFDKARLRIGERSMLDRVIECLERQTQRLIINVAADETDGRFPAGISIVPDRCGDGGPLIGIASGLTWAKDNTDARWMVSAPVDAPFLPDDLVSRLLQGLAVDAEIAVAETLGRVHPTVALWPVSMAEAMNGWIATSPQRAVKAWLSTRQWSPVSFPCANDIDPFFNVNTPDDLARARALAARPA